MKLWFNYFDVHMCTHTNIYTHNDWNMILNNVSYQAKINFSRLIHCIFCFADKEQRTFSPIHKIHLWFNLWLIVHWKMKEFYDKNKSEHLSYNKSYRFLEYYKLYLNCQTSNDKEWHRIGHVNYSENVE